MTSPPWRCRNWSSSYLPGFSRNSSWGNMIPWLWRLSVETWFLGGWFECMSGCQRVVVGSPLRGVIWSVCQREEEYLQSSGTDFTGMYIHILFILETGKGYTCRLCISRTRTFPSLSLRSFNILPRELCTIVKWSDYLSIFLWIKIINKTEQYNKCNLEKSFNEELSSWYPVLYRKIDYRM